MTVDNVTATPSSDRAHLTFTPDNIAVIKLGTPQERAITLTMARMESIKGCLAEIRPRRPRGLIILATREDMFTVGADINLINQVSDPKLGESLARQGQLLFEEIEELPFPTVAAISGPCVGGGCELALACTYRIISNNKSSIIGLPETKLGILPGFGGTLRLPKLIGLPRALDIILNGKTLKSDKALKAGLVDKVISFDLLEKTATEIILGNSKVQRSKLSLMDRMLTSTEIGRRIVSSKVRKDLLSKTKGFYPAPPAALEAALYGLRHGHKKGLENEAAELGRLIVTPECKSLVKVFFLTEGSKALGRSAAKDIEYVYGLVIGAGIMGAGIAGSLARSGANVILKDSSEDSLDKGIKHIRSTFEKSRSLTETEKSFALNRIEVTSKDSPNLSNVNFVIEAVPEDMQLKKKILGAISNLTTSNSIIASNTSSLSVTEIASAISNPGRVVGMHFFNPVEKMPLIEIIRGEKTSDKTIAITAALAIKLGKYPIVVRDVPGFLVNRILAPYLNEASYLLLQGFSVQDIDRAATRFGMPMGPIRLLDEVGLDVISHVSDVMVQGYGERMKVPGLASQLASLGRKGRKNGKGFYDFEGEKATPHLALKSILKLDSVDRKAPDPTYLQDRLILALVNESIRCLDEGVAGVPSKEAADQINLGTVMGMGFPPFRGGVIHFAESIGAGSILEKLSQFHREFGIRYEPAPGIRKRAESGKSFYQSA